MQRPGPSTDKHVDAAFFWTKDDVAFRAVIHRHRDSDAFFQTAEITAARFWLGGGE